MVSHVETKPISSYYGSQVTIGNVQNTTQPRIIDRHRFELVVYIRVQNESHRVGWIYTRPQPLV